jgi:hypothetical protein
MSGKPHSIIEPSKHVHQTPLFKLNKVSKTLYNLLNLGVGGVSRHPIRSISPQVQGVSQGKPIQVTCEYEVEWGKISKHGADDIQGFVLSHLRVPL